VPRKEPLTRLDSKGFKVAMMAYAEGKYGPGTKIVAANIDLSKVLPEPVDRETIRTWPYKGNPAIGVANLNAINQFLGIDCSLKVTKEEETEMVLANRPLTVEGQLVLEIYRHIFNFVDSVTFDSSLDEIEGNFFEVQREVEGRVVFLSPALKELVERALETIAIPLLNEEMFSAEYAPEIGHATPDGFYVDNLPLLVQVHEEIMTPYREKLHKLAADIQSML